MFLMSQCCEKSLVIQPGVCIVIPFSSRPSDDDSLAHASFYWMLTFDGHNNLVKSLSCNTLTTAYKIASLSSISPPAELQTLFTRQLTTVSSIQYECVYSLSSFFSTSLWTSERAFHLWTKTMVWIKLGWCHKQHIMNRQIHNVLTCRLRGRWKDC